MKNISGIGVSCTGCGACAARCPRGAIDLIPDREGFFAPSLDARLCVDCGLCAGVCPALSAPQAGAPQSAFAAYSLDAEAKARSSSGGLFSAAAEKVIGDGGSVFAVVLDEKTNEARFARADTSDALAPMRGSKYVQAIPKNVYNQIEQTLLDGKQALFVGCPCQVAALKNFLGDRRAENLFTIDIICHGVPSPGLFKAYMKWLAARGKAPVAAYRFRTKERGWGMCVGYTAGGRQQYVRSVFDPYNGRFLAGDTYRESCYQCPFARGERQGDWTIGDFWGVIREHPDIYSKDGVSALLVNTDKGRAFFDEVKQSLRFVPSTFEKIARHNGNLVRPSPRPAARDTVYEGLLELPPETYVASRLKVKPDCKSVVKALIPWRLKALYQKIKG